MTVRSYLSVFVSLLATASIALACESNSQSDTPTEASKPASTEQTPNNPAADQQEAKLIVRTMIDSARVAYTESSRGGGMAPAASAYPDTLEIPKATRCYSFAYTVGTDGQSFEVTATPSKTCSPDNPLISMQGTTENGEPIVPKVI